MDCQEVAAGFVYSPMLRLSTAHCDNEVIVNSYVGAPQANPFKALISEITQIRHQIVLFIKIQ